ncbi:gastrokine-1 isoform X2 [Spea bombifrons]|uniref:gastrokine-1 isoform X2 n=1 Tax=Spea bombifrons TaxID=233779 RepID=UPI002349A3B3|nr:gastrokine-1 isoform X2 [Spea bombifrons]
MKFLIVAAALLGVFLTQSQANDNIKINNSGNDGGSVSQNVNINNQDNIASINNMNGWNSWDSICDFGRGYAATRLYNKKICVVTSMKKGSFPTLAQLSAIAKDKKQTAPNAQLVTYTINQTPIVNIGEYGQHIESLCKGLPAYTAQEMPSTGRGFARCCSSSIITILGISLCF